MAIKHLPIAEFRRLGFLQEANRQFFHPLGLALEITREEDGTERISGVWDFRDDPEGVMFTDLSDDDAREKAAHVAALRESKRAAREALFFGDIVQPLGAVTKAPELPADPTP